MLGLSRFVARSLNKIRTPQILPHYRRHNLWSYCYMDWKSSNVEMAHATYQESSYYTTDHLQKYNLQDSAEELATVEEELTERKWLFKNISIIKIWNATYTYYFDMMELMEWRCFVEDEYWLS